jgi:hypothetical protein
LSERTFLNFINPIHINLQRKTIILNEKQKQNDAESVDFSRGGHNW